MLSRFVLLLMIALILTHTAFADEAKPEPIGVTAKGSFFTRFEWRENYIPTGKPAPLQDGSDAVRYRARLGLHTTPIDLGNDLTLKTQFEPQAGGFWHVGGDTLDDATIGLHTGALSLHHSNVQVEVGRFEMVYGDHLVIGNVGWHHLGRSFDAARARWRPYGKDGLWLDGFVSIIDEGFAASTAQGDDYGAGDLYFTGLYANIGPMIAPKLDLDLYALARIWGKNHVVPPTDTTTTPPTTPAPFDQDQATEATLGTRVKGQFNQLDYRLEAGVQIGNRRTAEVEAKDVFAYQVDAEIGFSPTKSFRLSLEGFLASGDDPKTADTDESYNQLFPTAHKWLGLMDVVGPRSNILGGVFHSSLDLQPLKFNLDAHMFWRPEVADDAETFQGTEINLGVTYPIAKELKLQGLYGQFIPEARESFDDHLHYVEIEVRTDF